jgi:hypothetical protein
MRAIAAVAADELKAVEAKRGKRPSPKRKLTTDK